MLKWMMLAAMVVGMLGSLGGCTTSRLAHATPEELREVDDKTLVNTFTRMRAYSDGDGTVLDEMARRFEWTDREVQDIRDSTIRRGYHRYQVFAALGPASQGGGKRTSALGSTETIRFGSLYVTLYNDEVQSWTEVYY